MTALDLFTYARQLRDEGMAQASKAQGPRWSDIAYQAIENIARKQIHVHVDDVLQAGVPEPHHPNAWGAVWMMAVRRGIIQRSNQTKPCMSDPKKHSHRYTVYFSRIYGSE